MLVLLGSLGCESGRTVLLREVLGPEGGDALTAVVVGDRVVVPTDLGVFASSSSQWVQQAGRGVGIDLGNDPSTAVAGFLRGGLQLNYSNASLIATHRDALWLVSRHKDRVVLLHSNDFGERWSAVPMPLAEDEEAVEAAAIEATELPRLVTGDDALFLVETTNIWRLDGGANEPRWQSVGLTGLPMSVEHLPPTIRNYLPRSASRPFEIVTVLTEQLLVLRRNDPADPWVLIATMATVDRALLGSSSDETVYLVSNDALVRSEDQGESWYPYWPANYPDIEVVSLVPRPRRPADRVRYDILVGASNGAIYRSDNDGVSWVKTRSEDVDGRAVTSIIAHNDALWATTQGQGVLFSADEGATWSPRNTGLRAVRPLDVTFSRNGELILASRAGLVQHSGATDSGTWRALTERATSAVGVDDLGNRIVWGTIHGELASDAVADAERGVTPFAEDALFEFAPHHLPRHTLAHDAVVAVVARDDGQRWVGWSQEHGAAFSDDGGESWSQLRLDEGLGSALMATTVRTAIAEPNDTIYLLEEHRDARTPALLWRTEDNGVTWTTVHAFARDGLSRVLIAPRPPNYPGVLYAANGDALLRSVDSGNSWTLLEGPWRGSRIIGLAVEQNRLALLLDARRRLDVVVVEGIDANPPRMTRHAVTFEASHVDPADVQRFELSERKVLLVGSRHLWIGELPIPRRPVDSGIAFVAMASGAVLLSLLTFAFIWSASIERRR